MVLFVKKLVSLVFENNRKYSLISSLIIVLFVKNLVPFVFRISI